MNKVLAIKWARRILKWTLITLAGLFVLYLLLAIFAFLPFQLAGLILFGWVAYLGRVIPQITFNPEIAFDAAVALALALFGLHRILCWWAKQRGDESAKWRFTWTLKISVMALLLFATSIAAVGMVHQIGWLCREPRLIYMSGMGKQTMTLSSMKQVALGLRLFAEDHDGAFPKKLDDLVPDYFSRLDLFFTPAMDGDPPLPIIYHAGYSTRDSDETIVLASPFEAFGGRKRVVACRDGSAMIIAESRYEELIQKQKPPVPAR